jgi:hypothetical protein
MGFDTNERILFLLSSTRNHKYNYKSPDNGAARPHSESYSEIILGRYQEQSAWRALYSSNAEALDDALTRGACYGDDDVSGNS